MSVLLCCAFCEIDVVEDKRREKREEWKDEKDLTLCSAKKMGNYAQGGEDIDRGKRSKGLIDCQERR